MIGRYALRLSNKVRKCVFWFSSQLDAPRQQMEYDVVIVGAGVAGLSTAIRLKQKEKQTNRPISVCVIEKGTEVGDHILSGNCFQPRGFDQLFPGWRTWKQNRPPIDTAVTSDNFYFLQNEKKSIKIPSILFPKTIDNHGNYIISLSKLTSWMGEQAGDMGVDIFTGTPGAQVLYAEDGSVRGVATKDFGISKEGKPRDNFVRGIQLLAKQTVFSQGARGSLSEKVIEKFNLRDKSDPQIYSIGLKEVWQVEENHKLFQPGYVQHSVGWPVPTDTYAGSFMYHMKPNLILVGLVVGLNYQNPYLNPYQEFQQFKTHPQIRKYLEGGRCISYGARALSTGGYFSLPKLAFPGGVLVGCSAGFMNVLKIKGSHTAIKSGLEAGNAIFQHLTEFQNESQKTVASYQKNMQTSWVWDELHSARNIKGSFKNMYTGLLYGGLYKFLGGKEPFDLRSKIKDSDQIKPTRDHKPIEYPKHDRKLTFDLLDNLSRSGTNHDHDQPSHLVVKPGMSASPLKSLKQFSGIEEKFCPAKVYEFVDDGAGGKKLQINAQNCLHCKTCSIKMVDQYIEWTVPEGTGGPKYNLM